MLFLVIVTLVSGEACNIEETAVITFVKLARGRTSVSFLIATNHNFNTFTVKGLLTGDTILVYHVNEAGDTTPVSVRDLNTNTDLNTNLITAMSGVHEFLVLNPNIYRLLIKCTATDIASKDLYIRRRGNNLK